MSIGVLLFLGRVRYDKDMRKQRQEENILTYTERMMHHPRFRFWKAFAKTFPKSEVYLVGGAVRDIAMERVTKDFDFVVRNVPAQQLQKFLERRGRVNLVGKRFGVLKFVPKGWNGEALDIALPRTDHSFNSGGYKDFMIKSNPRLSIEDDLARRDFTVNAIAAHVTWNMKHVTVDIVDPFNGLRDIQKKTLRTVGEPRERFREDYSRMLRALRFACQLGFSIERKTWMALKQLMPRVNTRRSSLRRSPTAPSRQARTLSQREYIVPRETVGRECIKAFVTNPLAAFGLWENSGAIKALLPELLPMQKCLQPKQFHSEGDVWTHTRLALAYLVSPQFRRRYPDIDPRSALAVFGVLLHDIGKPKMLRTPARHGTDRIRFDGHDLAGSIMVARIVERLRLSQFPKDDARHHIAPEMLVWLIRHHMLFNEKIVRAMKATTLEKYFLKDHYRGRLFQALAWVDMAASVPARGKQDWKPLKIVQRRLRTIEKQLRHTHVRSLLNGTEIMRRFSLQPSPFIGQLLDALREEQLQGRVRTKKQAWAFLKTKV